MEFDLGHFPFGQPVKKVEQIDRSPKKVFVLGVYASAVHARWIGPDGKILIKALAVASEPKIFWPGTNAQEIVENIALPLDAGNLVPAEDKFNGPSAHALDDKILDPLSLSRDDSWLCDLVPYSCINSKQEKALERVKNSGKIKWHPIMESKVKPLHKPIVDENRVNEIYLELKESRAKTIIVLGDLPIKWFIKYFDDQWKRLDDFVKKGNGYGVPYPVKINDIELSVLPLAHPRQIAKLGRSNKFWFEKHREWCQNQPTLSFL
jgi:hypothetical protein